MEICTYQEYCKTSNKGKGVFTCYNPPYCLENVCELFRPSNKNNHKIELFRPDEEMIKQEMIKIKKERKMRRKKYGQ